MKEHYTLIQNRNGFQFTVESINTYITEGRSVIVLSVPALLTSLDLGDTVSVLPESPHQPYVGIGLPLNIAQGLVGKTIEFRRVLTTDKPQISSPYALVWRETFWSWLKRKLLGRKQEGLA